MSTKAEVQTHDVELAPSQLREDQMQVMRWVGTIGLALALVGFDWICWLFLKFSVSAGIIKLLFGKAEINILATMLGTPMFLFGLAMMLSHAAVEKDIQLRRVYGGFGGLWLTVGAVLALLGSLSTLMPKAMEFGLGFFVPGIGCLLIGLIFVLAYIRNESEKEYKEVSVWVVGGLGAATLAAGFVLSTLNPVFVAPNGVLLIILGLIAVWAFVSLSGDGDHLGNLAAIGTFAVGAVFFVIAFIRSFIVPMFTKDWTYAVPLGVVLMGSGLVTAGLYCLLRLDFQFVVILRRELASFFCSPIAYAALLASAGVAGISFFFFLGQIAGFGFNNDPAMPEPIVADYLGNLLPLLTGLGLVPVLTMNTFSDESRSGTLEMTLTAPVDEKVVVFGKFFATWLFYMLAWIPWVLMLSALAILGREPFDFTPLLSFLIALSCMAAAWVSMGNFFSSLTRQRDVAALATALCLLLLLSFTFLIRLVRQIVPLKGLAPVFEHMSFIPLWFNSAGGRLEPNYLVFQISATIFWIFLTLKVLESRKWK